MLVLTAYWVGCFDFPGTTIVIYSDSITTDHTLWIPSAHILLCLLPWKPHMITFLTHTIAEILLAILNEWYCSRTQFLLFLIREGDMLYRPFTCWIVLKKHKHIFLFCIKYRHSSGKGYWNISCGKTKISLAKSVPYLTWYFTASELQFSLVSLSFWLTIPRSYNKTRHNQNQWAQLFEKTFHSKHHMTNEMSFPKGFQYLVTFIISPIFL